VHLKEHPAQAQGLRPANECSGPAHRVDYTARRRSQALGAAALFGMMGPRC
jgi:hypothetical protein